MASTVVDDLFEKMLTRMTMDGAAHDGPPGTKATEGNEGKGKGPCNLPASNEPKSANPIAETMLKSEQENKVTPNPQTATDTQYHSRASKAIREVADMGPSFMKGGLVLLAAVVDFEMFDMNMELWGHYLAREKDVRLEQENLARHKQDKYDLVADHRTTIELAIRALNLCDDPTASPIFKEAMPELLKTFLVSVHKGLELYRPDEDKEEDDAGGESDAGKDEEKSGDQKTK